MSQLNDEPSLEKIDDYNNNESSEKKRTVRYVIIFCLAVGALFAYLKSPSVPADDYVGTKEKPGIDMSKK
jgi:hypothetical protein